MTALMHAAVPVDSAPLKRTPTRLLAFFRSEDGRKTLRFAAVSVVAIVVSQIAIAVTYGGFRMSKTAAQSIAVLVSTIPSYELNRRWVWGRNGKSSKSREIAPFWIISVVQFVLSLIAVNFLGGWMEGHVSSHLLRTLGLQAIVLLVYGVMWVGKFVFFNRVLFVDRAATAVSSS